MKKAVILIHGLTGSPATMAPLTNALGQAGFHVLTPLLPGHGTSPEELNKSTWQEWYNAVKKAYCELDSNYEIYCAGLSLGSLLTLKLAVEKPIKKIACLGTPLKLSPLLDKFIPILSQLPVVKSLIRMSKKDWKASVKDFVGREMYKSLSYSKIPIHSVFELQKLQRDVIPNLGRIKSQVLIIHSKNDKVAKPFNVDMLAKGLNLKPEIIWLNQSEHVMILDLEKDIVIQKITEFFLNQE